MTRFGKTLMYSAIGVLTLGALYAIGVVLFGEFDDFEFKVLGTTFIIGAGSIGWLCCAMFSGRRNQPVPGFVGMALVAFSAVLLIGGIWGEINSDGYWKLTGIVTIWAVAVAHFLVLLSLTLRRKEWWLYVLTGMTTAVLALVMSGIILADFDVEEGAMKFIVVLSILAALATVVIPIVSKMTQPKMIAVAAGIAPPEAEGMLQLVEQPDGTYTDPAGRRYCVEQIDAQAHTEMADD